MELCVAPRGEFTYSGSKGREYFDHNTARVLEAEELPQDLGASGAPRSHCTCATLQRRLSRARQTPAPALHWAGRPISVICATSIRSRRTLGVLKFAVFCLQVHTPNSEISK